MTTHLRGSARQLMMLGILLASPLSLAAQGVSNGSLEDGDLFVGGQHAFDARTFNYAGIIQHVRGSTVTVWCQSPEGFFPDEHWSEPYDVLVDSQGRVVFLARVLSIPVGGYGGIGLFRCNGPGLPAEKLAVFPYYPHSTFSGFPFTGPPTMPNLGRAEVSASGLHLARHRTIAIDDDVLRSVPKLATDDAYVLVIAPNIANSGESPVAGLPQALRYRVASDEWEDGPQVVQGAFAGQSCGNCGFIRVSEPDAIFHQGATYSGAGHVIGRDKDPFRVKIAGHIGTFSFEASLFLFGGYKQLPKQAAANPVGALVTDDLSISDTVPSGCPGPPPNGITDRAPVIGGVMIPLAGVGTIGFDEYGPGGLVMTSNFGRLPRVLTNVSEALINDLPFDDDGARFQSANGCFIWDKLAFTPVVNGMDFTQLASTRQGVVGTQRQGTVAFVTSTIDDPPIVSALNGLEGAAGLAAWPPAASPGFGGVLIIRIDSPVDVLLTDSTGRKLGVENGQLVNDFGSDGFDSGAATHPRFYAINSPAPGNYAVDSVGTSDGPFTVHVYTADLDKPLGEHISRTGAAPGSVAEHDFTITVDGALSFSNGPPVETDTIAPATVASASPGPNAAGWNKADATVALSSVDNLGGSGVESLTYALTGAQTGAAALPGSSTSILITAEGTTTVTFGARDNAGNVETPDTIVVRLDKTSPTVTQANLILEATSGTGAVATFGSPTATDATSGIASVTSSPESGSTFSIGATTVTATATDDAGNSSTKTFTVTVRDTTAPSIDSAADVLAEATSASGAAVAFPVPGTADAVSGPGAASCLPTPGSVFPFGAVTVVCSAHDGAGNTATSTFRVTVSDTTAPQVTPPPDQSVNQTSASGALVDYPAPSIIEIGSGLLSSTCAPASGSAFPLGATTVTCSATDRAGNTGSAAFSISVIATSSPNGRLHGVGYIGGVNRHHHFLFRVSQVGSRDWGRLNYWVNDSRRDKIDDEAENGRDGVGDRDYGRDHRNALQQFEATAVTTAVFADDLTFEPGRRLTIDSVVFAGVGKWNGRSGYTFEARATDQGEPGRHRDTFSLVVKDSTGTTVATVTGELDGGNVQSTRIRP